MSALSTPAEAERLIDGTPEQEGGEPAGALSLALQFCRANAMSLARLQLALKSGDRQCALEAMDRLHALDTEMERLVQRLPRARSDDQEWGAIEKHLADQKLAISFEKLALVSEISGPGVVSPPTLLPPEAVELPASLAETAEYAPEETGRKPIPMGTIIGFLLAFLTMAAMAAAAMVMTSL
ncbi:hypothetical protein [Caenibius sp. WL]|uniref:hypothetical protein n=1 Tax=Caenibius sp. WL TaxID=2872646 RepID=UPI001C9A15A4|nr:hypothetical protein [Caenibius sp. WL]QZP08243.1 hypothetical protein K5X80_16690 [Caenibius sp. WL]